MPVSRDEQIERGTARNRAVAWLARHSYRDAVVRAALFGLAIGLVSNLDRVLPSLSPQPGFAWRSLAVSCLIATAVGAILGVLVLASARGAARVYARAHSDGRPA